MLHSVTDLGCLRLPTSLPPCFFILPLPLLLSPSSNCMSNQCSPGQPSTRTFLPHSSNVPFWLSPIPPPPPPTQPAGLAFLRCHCVTMLTIISLSALFPHIHSSSFFFFFSLLFSRDCVFFSRAASAVLSSRSLPNGDYIAPSSRSSISGGPSPCVCPSSR